MRKHGLAFAVLPFALAMSAVPLVAAERDQSGNALERALKSKPVESGSSDIPHRARNNSCAEFGPGFVRIAGSSTCVRVGGSISADVGMQR